MSTIIQKLLKRLNESVKNIPTAPSLSQERQIIQYRFTVIGIIASVLLGIASLTIAIKVKNTSVKIDKMDTLIKELAKQDTTNQKALAALIDISNKNSLSIGKLDSILKELYHQYTAATTNTEPKLKLGDPVTYRINPNSQYFELPFTNTGNRDAVKLDVETYIVYDDGKFVKTELTTMPNHNDLTMTPGQTQSVHFDISLDSTAIKNLSYRFRFKYIDKLTSKPYEQTFHFNYEWNDNKIIQQKFNSTAYALKMDSLISAIQIKPKKKKTKS